MMKIKFSVLSMLSLSISVSASDTSIKLVRNLDDVCGDSQLETDVNDLCHSIGCECSCDDATPDPCGQKSIRLKLFKSKGEDRYITNMNYEEYLEGDESLDQDRWDGGDSPIEIRFTLFNDESYYPGNSNECGAGSVNYENSILQSDGERYCQIFFGDTLEADDNSDWRDITPYPSGQWTVPFSMLESDNRWSAAFTTGQLNMSPREWYDGDECNTYEIVVWKDYYSNRQGICYRSSSRLDNLNVYSCDDSRFNFPDDDFYMFTFEVRSNNDIY